MDAAKDGKECIPVVKMIDGQVADKLYLRGDKSCFFFLCKNPEAMLGLYSVDRKDKDIVATLHERQPNAALEDFAQELAFFCRPAPESIHQRKEVSCVKMCFYKFTQDQESGGPTNLVANKITSNSKISPSNLTRLILDLLSRFNTLLEEKKTKNKMMPMMLLSSPFTISQSPEVLSRLIEFVGEASSLDGVSQLNAFQVLMNHLLALRQNGRTLSEVTAIDKNFGSSLLAALCKLEERSSQINDQAILGHFNSNLQSCFSKFKSLLSEYSISANEAPLREFPALHSAIKIPSAETHVFQSYDLPASFISEATETIRIKSMTCSVAEGSISGFKAVFWNGQRELTSAAFGEVYEEKSYEITNDRQWTRKFQVDWSQTIPFRLESLCFGDVEIAPQERDTEAKIVSLTEKLEQGEFISGFTTYLENNTLKTRSINFKRKRMPQFNASPALIPLTLGEVKKAKISQHAKNQMMAFLLNCHCPYTFKNLEDGPSQEEIKQSIVAYFSAKVGSSEFSTGFNFLSYFASVAMKREDADQINQVRVLFDTAWEALMKPGNNEPDSLCSLTIAATASMMIVNDREELANRAFKCMNELTEKAAGNTDQVAITRHKVFQLFNFVVLNVTRQRLTPKEDKKASSEEAKDLKVNEEAMVVDLLNQSDLFSGGLERKWMHTCSEETLAKLRQHGQTLNLDLFEKKENEKADGQLDALHAVITQGKNKSVDQVVKALQDIILKDPRLRVTAMSQGQIGLRLQRCAFAVMLKFSGQVKALENVLDSLETASKEEGKAKPTDQEIVKIVQQNKDSSKLIKLWTSATKMRAWLQEEKTRIALVVNAKFQMKELNPTDEEKKGLDLAQIQALELMKSQKEELRVSDLRDREESLMVDEIVKDIEEKANFLILMDSPHYFNSLDEDSEEFRRQITIVKEIEQSSEGPHSKLFAKGIFASLKEQLQNKFSELKKLHKETANLKNRQEKLTELREAGISSVLACLQAKVTVQHIRDKVERQYLSAAERLVGLTLLSNLMEFAISLGKEGEGQMLQAVSVLCQCLQSNSEKMVHYLDGLSGCGNFFEDKLRDQFFGIIQKVLKHLDGQSLLKSEFIQSLQWNYKAKDFKYLIQFGLLRYLIWGRTKQGISGYFGSQQSLSTGVLDPVVRAHTFEPNGRAAKALHYTFNDLFLSILTQFVAQNDRESVSIPLDEKQTQVSIQRSITVVDSSEFETILSRTFDIVFHEFQLFLDISEEFQHCKGINGKSFEEVHAFMVECLNRKKATGKADSDEPVESKQTETMQQTVNRYREKFEEMRLDSMLSLVDVFICIATTHEKSQQLLQSVINASHIKTLSRMFVQASPKMKIIVLHIFQNFITIKMPDEVFNSGLKESSGLKTGVTFTNMLAQVLFSFAVQIRSGKWQSAYKTESGLSDVLVHLTRTISLSLRQTGNTVELENALERVAELPEAESDVLLHILGAHNQRFVYQDRLLDASENKLTFQKFTKDVPSNSVVCPEINHPAILLGKPAICSLIKTLCSNKANTIIKGKATKLLCLQQLHNQDFTSLLDPPLKTELVAHLLQHSSQSNAASKHSLRNLEFMLSFTQTKQYDSYPASSITDLTKTDKALAGDARPKEGDRVETVKKFMMQTGTKLHEVVFALSDGKEEIKSEYSRLLNLMANEAETKLKESQNQLGRFLNEKLQSAISGLSPSDLLAKLKSIKPSEVTKLLGNEVTQLQAKADREIFSFGLADNSLRFTDGIKSALSTNLKVEDTAQAKQLFAKKKVTQVPLSYFKQVPKGFNDWTLDDKLKHLKSTGLHLGVELPDKNVMIPTHEGHRLSSTANIDRSTQYKCRGIRNASICMSSKMGAYIVLGDHDAYCCKMCFNQFFCVDCMKANILIDRLQTEGEQESIEDLASAFHSKLAAKLLFAISDCSDISDSERDLSLLSALLSYYAEASAELSNRIPGAIWECTFRPRVLSQLALPKDQREESFSVYEGSESNIHKVLASVQLPSVDDLKTKMLSILTGLHKRNSEIVNRLIQSQVIGKFFRQCVNSHEFRGSNSLDYDNLGSVISSEDQRKSGGEVQELTVEEQAQGVWFVNDASKTHTKTFILRDGGECCFSESQGWDKRKGTWKVVFDQEQHEIFEIQVEQQKFEFRWNVNRKAELKDHEGHEVRQMMDYSQLAGTWLYYTDISANPEGEQILTSDRKGLYNSYDHAIQDSPYRWKISEDGGIFLYGQWEHYWVFIDSNTLQDRWTSYKQLKRLTPMPKKTRHSAEKDLIGKWWWTDEDGKLTEEQKREQEPDEILENGTYKTACYSETGTWKIEDDGTFWVKRENQWSEKAFKWIDQNTLEQIQPDQDPPNCRRMLRAEPVQERKTVHHTELKLSSSQLQVNSLMVNLMQADPCSWPSLLPQLFEMILFSLCLATSPLKIRKVLEQCQILLHAAHESKSISQSTLRALVTSNMVNAILRIAKEQHVEGTLPLIELLIADILVQQQALNSRLEEAEPIEDAFADIVSQLKSLRRQFFSDDLFCDGIKKAFYTQHKDELPDCDVPLKTVKVTQADTEGQRVEVSQCLENAGDKKLFCTVNKKSAQGSLNCMFKVTYQEDGSEQTKYVELDSDKKWPVEADFTIEPVPLPELFIAQTSVREDVDESEFTRRYTMIESLNLKIDEVIQIEDFGAVMWCNGYTELKELEHNMVRDLTLPQKIKDRLEGDRPAGWKRPDIKVMWQYNLHFILFEGELIQVQSNTEVADWIEGNHKVLDFVGLNTGTMVIITTDGLYEMALTNLLSESSQFESTTKKITSDVFPDLEPGMQFKRLWIQSNDPTNNDIFNGYLYVEVEVGGVKKLYSYGKNAHGCLGDGRDPNSPEAKFHEVIYDNKKTTFKNLYLSSTLAFGVTEDNKVWLLGGKANFKNETLFPFGFDQPITLPIETGLASEIGHPIVKIVSTEDEIWILFKTGDFTHCKWIIVDQGETTIDMLNFYRKGCGLEREIVPHQNWHFDLMVDDMVNFLNQKTYLFIKKCPSFPAEFSVEFNIGPEASDKTEEQFDSILNGNQKWETFKEDFLKAFKSRQFLGSCMDSLNAFFSANEIELTQEHFVGIDTETIELKGDCFSADKDREMARSVLKKLLIINGLQAKLAQSKLGELFETDPFIYESSCLGLPTTVRNWHIGLRSMQKYLVEKSFEKRFDDAVKKLPKNDDSRVDTKIDRFAAIRFANAGKVDTGDGDTVFMQIMRQLKLHNPDLTIWRKGQGEAVFKANLEGEKAIDAGGPYRAAHDWLCKEVQSSVLPLLIPTENQRNVIGDLRESFILNHAPTSEAELEQFFFMGLWIGNAIRSGEPLNLMIHPTVWQRLVGQEEFSLFDLKTIDLHKFNELSYLRTAASQVSSNEEFQMVVEQNFTVTYGAGKQMRTIELSPGGFSKMVGLDTIEEYINLAVNALIMKDEVQMKQFKRGVYHVLSRSAVHSCSWNYAEGRACGKQEINIDLLKDHTTWNADENRKLADDTPLKDAFWKMLKEFSEDNKKLYLKFVNGRSKLPLDIANETRTHTVNGMGGNNATLPQAHTCFNTLDLPPYTDYDAMVQRMLTAIQFCGEIDTDG